MAKLYINEGDIKEITEKMKLITELGQKEGISINPVKYSVFNPLQVVLAVSIDRLDKSSKRLNYLTWALVGLTVVLAILTGISVWKIFCP